MEFGPNTPELGRTQYFLGAVVLILNITFISVGFIRRMNDVTGTLKGPANNSLIYYHINTSYAKLNTNQTIANNLFKVLSYLEKFITLIFKILHVLELNNMKYNNALYIVKNLDTIN